MSDIDSSLKPNYCVDTAERACCNAMMAVIRLRLTEHILLTAIAFLLLSTPGGTQSRVVVDSGQPLAAVIVAADLADGISAALADLVRCTRTMAGAALPIRTIAPPGLPALYLAVEASPQGCPDLRALSELNQEGFLVRTRDGSAWICGRTRLAVQHGVYWLLEQWGCRWLFPGQAGEVIPRRNHLAITEEMQTAQQPHFLMRSIWYNFGSYLPKSVEEEHDEWLRRNRLEYSLRGSIGHAYDSFVSRRNDALFADHPEYFPGCGCLRFRWGQICTGNAQVRARAVEYAVDYFRRYPDSDMVSMSPNDGLRPWRCRENSGYLSFTDAAIDLANHVAEAIQSDPATRDKLVAVYAYLSTAFAPSIPARDNVIVFLATRLSWAPWTWRAPAWKKKARRLGIRDYASIIQFSQTRPTWGLQRLERNLRLWVKHGVEAVSVESGNDWGGWGLYHYVLARLLWDPTQSVDQLYDDFLRTGFGPAAPAMNRYFGTWKLGYTPAGLPSAMRCVSNAMDLADTDSRRWRVAQYGLYLHHLRLLSDYRSAQDSRERLEALESLVAFDWRLLPTNMAHTGPLVDRYLRQEALSRYHVSPDQFERWKRTDPFTIDEARELLSRHLR